MSDILLVAIVGFAGIIGTGVLSPLVLGWLNARSRIREKEEGPSRWPGAAGESVTESMSSSGDLKNGSGRRHPSPPPSSHGGPVGLRLTSRDDPRPKRSIAAQPVIAGTLGTQI